jgi:periplasmic copper chaperone A
MSWKLAIGAIGACVGLLAASAPTVAHVTLERQEATVGSSYKAVLRVPHGCSGSPTTAVRVRLPAGLIGVKPMPKPGWELSTVLGKYPKPYTLRGAPVTEGVTEIAWSGGKLLDAHYDEFVFTGAIAEELGGGQTIYFPVVQECEKGVHRWIEIPTGKSSHGGHGAGSSEPAAALRLLPKQ